jgi:hypothetical protein
MNTEERVTLVEKVARSSALNFYEYSRKQIIAKPPSVEWSLPDAEFLKINLDRETKA